MTDGQPERPKPLFVLRAYGDPGPQGSKAPTGTYYRTKAGGLAPHLKESSKKVKPWRQAVKDAATVELLRNHPRPWTPLDGPIAAEAYFTLDRGKTVTREHHTTYPDLDKLLRSSFDALTDARVIADDARICIYLGVGKFYPHASPYALDRPGAIIRLWRHR